MSNLIQAQNVKPGMTVRPRGMSAPQQVTKVERRPMWRNGLPVPGEESVEIFFAGSKTQHPSVWRMSLTSLLTHN